MLLEERHEYILKKIQETGFVRVSELAEELSVTTRTVRRDLEMLEDEGLLKRTHGGARWIGARHTRDQSDLPIHVREEHHGDEKLRIAKIAVSMITPGSHIILDAGTTTLAIARHLPPDMHLTVITNAINIASELGHRQDIELIVCGGNFRPSTWSLVGPHTEKLLRNISADIAFIGATGISKTIDFTNSNLFEAEVKRAMIRAAAEAWVVADHSKFGRTALARFATADEVTGLITDEGVSEEDRQRLRATRLDVRYA